MVTALETATLETASSPQPWWAGPPPRLRLMAGLDRFFVLTGLVTTRLVTCDGNVLDLPGLKIVQALATR